MVDIRTGGFVMRQFAAVLLLVFLTLFSPARADSLPEKAPGVHPQTVTSVNK